MTIYQIKQATRVTAPHYFERSTMKFFGQRMRDFRVQKQADGRYKIAAQMRGRDGRNMGQSVRFFNPVTNELERE